MRRREFIAGLGGAASAWPLAARAQKTERVRRIGILMPYPNSDAVIQARVQVFRQELARLGWLAGRTVQFDERWSTDDMDLVRADAAALVARAPDVIFITSDRAIPVFTKLTRSIPIVVVLATDPLGSGAVESLARPGHNVTGFSNFELSLFGKMLETLQRLVPGVSRVGMLHNPDNPLGPAHLNAFATSAPRLAVQPLDLPIRDAAGIERAVAGMAEQPNGGILVAPDLTAFLHRAHLVALAARDRVPAIYSNAVYTEAGGLISYGTDSVGLFRQSAGYVDRILRGEKAGELPFQQPTTYQLVINLKTAAALGLAVSPTLLTLADEVIE